MGNVLEQDKQQQVLALGRLGWTLTRIGHATGVHRVTAGEYLRRDSRARTRAARRSGSKTDNFRRGVHRLRFKTGHFPDGGVHRLAAIARADGPCL